ncbi:MAG: transketolase C-terminal domain-containing protein [Bacteroidales bacterium]|nr:transketolase C-terminal domain-containing protein [Bacteroidales bacterium]
METYKESLIAGLRELLQDPKCYLLGEDICEPYGGAYTITKGMSTDFPGKLINTPMSEQGFTGMGVGMALAGYKPIIEIMFGDFSTLIMDQILNHASKFVEGFEKPLHLVVRDPMGGYRGYGATHSQSLEKLYVGLPNIAVISPSVLHEPGDLLVKSMNLGLPVIFVENKLDYTRKLFKAEKIADNFKVKYQSGEFPVAEVVFPDEDAEVTIISYGGLINPLLNMMYDLYMEEEVVTRLLDLSSLTPMDFDFIAKLTKDSKKILCVEEGHVPFGIGDGIISNLAQRGMKSEFKSIGAKQHIIGTSKEAEAMALPQIDEIKETILNW